MKNTLFLALFAASAILAGCSADKSAETQTVTPNGGVPYGAAKGSADPHVPASAAPGVGK